MIFARRRLFFWIVNAYIKKWRRMLLVFFLIGLFFFFALVELFKVFLPKIPIGKRESIGIVGAYTLNNLPSSVSSLLSYGLTSFSNDGTPIPGAAKSWNIENDGKKYTFYLKDKIYFTDHSHVDSSLINYQFSNVIVEKPSKYVIIFILKDSYSPFLTTVSRPLFKNGLVGIGGYRVKDIKLNGDFIEFITLQSVKNEYEIKKFHFYPTSDALKTAFVLGEVSKVIGVNGIDYREINLSSFPNIKIEKKVNYDQLVTLFFNTQDSVLSDKKIRNGLSYSLADEFPGGKRSFAPYAPFSWSYTDLYSRAQDISHAKSLLSESSSNNSQIKLVLKTLPRYKDSAEEIVDQWKKIGVLTKLEVVNTVPSTFQVFLGDFHLSSDPDQYTLWHSNQENNITNYKNLRIDKLLEDGRKTIDTNERKKIYADFQKYLLDDSPATFIHFPYEYELMRK